MITRTSEIAIKALVFLALHGQQGPITPHEIAEKMGCSPSYLGKTMGQLVKAGILTSQRGPQGGMTLAVPPEKINLLMVVEACQGLLIGAYCKSIGDELAGPVCAYHRAMWDVRQATVEALRRWTLKHLSECPLPTGALAGNEDCRMVFLAEEAPQP
ncbi:Rrf2 family transcriptional regulator [bacterium]|nr:Rrf2 family transcriptional regulator [bacterium]